jgi:hypothetical protein
MKCRKHFKTNQLNRYTQSKKGDQIKLKKVLIATLILVLCSLLLLVGIANAGNEAYSVTEYQWIEGATIDGVWTTPDEWNDGPQIMMSNNANFTFNLDITSGTFQWIIEFFGDTTNDPGDYVRISLDPENQDAFAPGETDRRITVDGNGDIEVMGGPTVWIADIGQGEIVAAQSLSASPWESTPHKIVEISDPNKNEGPSVIWGAPPNGMYVAAYDATTQTLATWPPISDDPNDERNPSAWGVIAASSTDPIPEGFSLAFVAVLSSVAVAVSVYFVRKRPKPKTIA